MKRRFPSSLLPLVAAALVSLPAATLTAQQPAEIDLGFGPAVQRAPTPELAEDDAPAAAEDATTTSENPLFRGQSGEQTRELVQERYPNRRVKIAREVILNEKGNYVHDGSWKMWDEAGTIVAEGQYQNNQRHGTWNRWYRGNESPIFGQAPYSQYTAPFISQATFEDGRLHGKWTIYDAKQRKISEIEFADGQRHGAAAWWLANGRKLREITYDHGLIDGQYLEWTADSRVVRKDTFEQGRKIAAKVSHHSGQLKKAEGVYLFARTIVKSQDDWWNARFAEYSSEGKDERHGPWTAWFPSGQKQEEGEFKNDIPVGQFTWWYANGQKRLEGEYVNGRRQGPWSWWHDNGQKATHGEYANDTPVGRWAWWHKDGKLARAANFAAAEVAEQPEPLGPTLRLK